MPSIRGDAESTIAGGREPDGLQSVRRVEWPTLTKVTGDRGPGQGNDADGDVVVVMSAEARALAGDGKPMATAGSSMAAPSSPAETTVLKPSWDSRTPDGKPLTPAQTQQVVQLRARDTEVRAHEAAHVAASGGLGRSPTFSYEEGPDGKRYAVGGEVAIDTTPGRTPEETIARARTIRVAATAPADPSAQDMAVAASAARMEAQAQSEIQVERHVAWQSTTAPPSDPSDPAARDGAAPAADPAAHAADREITLMTLSRERASARDGNSPTDQASYGLYRRAASAYTSARPSLQSHDVDVPRRLRAE